MLSRISPWLCVHHRVLLFLQLYVLLISFLLRPNDSLRTGRQTVASVIASSGLTENRSAGNRMLKLRSSPNIMIPIRDPNLTFGLGKIAFSGLALSPESSGRRKTIITEVVQDEVWTLEQVQGIINVNVPVRSTVIKLSSGGLWINNPVAPTKECISMIRDIERRHGQVKYIVLSTLGVEHKVRALAKC